MKLKSQIIFVLLLLFFFAMGINAQQFTFVESFGFKEIDGASSIAVGPDGCHVYVTSLNNDALSVFACDLGTGTLTFLETFVDGINGVDGLDGANSIVVSPDGRHVYTTGFEDGAIAVFARDLGSGMLTFMEVVVDGTNGIDGLAGATSIVVSPDARHLYVTGFEDGAVAAFVRDMSNGKLTFVEAFFDGFNGIDGLAGATSVTVSPDSLHVYVTGLDKGAVVAFSRDVTNGTLTFIDKMVDGRNTQDIIDGLAGASSVTVSPDARHVYVAGPFDDAVAIFDRDIYSGNLSFKGSVKDGIAGIDGLDGAVSVKVSPDSRYVYVASAFDNAVTVFARNASTGNLTFMKAIFDGRDCIDGLAGASSIAIGPDNTPVYVASLFDNTVAVFSRVLEH